VLYTTGDAFTEMLAFLHTKKMAWYHLLLSN